MEYIYFLLQVHPLPFGTTVAGSCNGIAGAGPMSLYHQHGIYVTDNGTLYIADTGNARVQAFLPNSLSGVTILFNMALSYAQLVVANSNASIIYVSDFNNDKVFLSPQNLSIPQQNTGGGCALNQLNGPTGLAVDSQDNVYVSDRHCNRVLKWNGSNANTSIVVAGTGVAGSGSTQLYNPYGLYLDEGNAVLYVADLSNHRIQKFFLNSNNTSGVTVAGGNGPGTALNQLVSPCGFAVSRKDGSIYVADNDNNRIVRWMVNATQGIVVAGDSSGVAGNTALLLNAPFEVKFDANETFFYVSDLNNNRVQRFPKSP
jgi:sugar lactone lactonase YvrE